MPRDETTHSTTHVRLLLGGCQAAGLDPDAMLALVGLSRDAIAEPEGRVPNHKVFALWEAAAGRSGDPAFGLHVAARQPQGSAGVVEHIFRNCATLSEGYDSVCRYARLLNNGAEIRLYREGTRARLTYRITTPGRPPRALADWVLGALVAQARAVTGHPFTPSEVCFHYDPPPDLAPYQAFFRCRLRHGAALDEIKFDAELLELRVREADPTLSRVLTRYGEELLGRLPSQGPFIEALRRLLVDSLTGGEPQLSWVAQQLAVSPRTLQRRLREHDTSYQQLLQSLRDELAGRYLAERDVPIAEVAFLLGFSQPSAFHRSFKRWRGMTPAEYRELARGG